MAWRLGILGYWATRIHCGLGDLAAGRHLAEESNGDQRRLSRSSPSWSSSEPRTEIDLALEFTATCTLLFAGAARWTSLRSERASGIQPDVSVVVAALEAEPSSNAWCGPR